VTIGLRDDNDAFFAALNQTLAPERARRTA
jgi:hypothetical protein